MVRSEAQKRADAKYEKNNRERKNFLTKRSVARNFIKKLAQKEDLDELEEYIKIRREELK